MSTLELCSQFLEVKMAAKWIIPHLIWTTRNAYFNMQVAIFRRNVDSQQMRRLLKVGQSFRISFSIVWLTMHSSGKMLKLTLILWLISSQKMLQILDISLPDNIVGSRWMNDDKSRASMCWLLGPSFLTDGAEAYFTYLLDKIRNCRCRSENDSRALI